MRKYLFVFCCVALIAVGAAAQSYTAILTGAAEVPGPGDPDGLGVALITIEGTTVHYSIVPQNIGTASAAHIHPGAVGVAGGVAIGFNAATLTGGSAPGNLQTLID